MFTKITKDIHKLVIQFPKGMGAVNCYLMEGKHGYTVIDTGTDSKEAREGWEKVLTSGMTIERVVLTHAHQDHIGLAKWFQQDLGIPVIVSDLSYKEMQKNRVPGVRERLNQLVIKHGGEGLPDHIEDESAIYDFVPDGLFENHQHIQLGDYFYQAIWTPGHAPDHFCFYNKEAKVMIIGDHVLKEISPVIGLWSGIEQNVLRDYLISLELMKQYPTEIALPGHGESIYHLNARVDAIRQKHVHRLEQVLASVNEKSKTVNEVCDEIYGIVNILNPSSFMAILTRFLYLESIGKVARMERDGNISFKACYSTFAV